jgi:hypothetical protein
MVCQKCGHEIDESQTFCKFCGATRSVATQRTRAPVPAKPVPLADVAMPTSHGAESQPKPEQSRLARAILWGLGILFALVALHALTSDTEQSAKQDPEPPSDSQQTPAHPPTVGREQAQEPPFSAVEGDTTYHGVSSSDVGVAVLKVTSGQILLGIEPIKADGKFIIVGVAIFNAQNTAITMDTGLFEILDSNGNVYSASERSAGLGATDNLFLAQLNPGIMKTGEIVFDVPQNVTMDNLLLRFRGGMAGETATLPLRVDSTVQQTAAPSDPNTRPKDNAPVSN